MSAMKEYAEHITRPNAALEEIAKRLGGEVEGGMVVMPSPGMPADDRSLVVRVNAAKLTSFYIYGCTGALWRAKGLIRLILNLDDQPKEETGWTSEPERIWQGAEPNIAGTVVESYLRWRAIDLPVWPKRLRFYPKLRHPDGGSWPAMVAMITNVNDSPIGLHQTWLSPSGRGKAGLEHPRRVLGSIEGGAIRLSTTGDELYLGEGIETALSAMVAGKAAWATVNAFNLGKVELPKQVARIFILVDGDRAGEMGAAAGSTRWLMEGREVRLCRAPPGKDFNDLLMARTQS
jgi:hypothetical protein